MKRPITNATLIALALTVVSVAFSTTPARVSSEEKLGKVSFPVSCTPQAQAEFERGLAMLHSFFFPETVKVFTQVTQTDPSCAMGYWGLAMSTRPNPLIPLDVATLKKGWEAVEKAKAAGAKTQRERDYIAAMEVYYKDPEKGAGLARAQAYEKAMEQVYLSYPTDAEAAIFYALALNEATDYSDKTYTRQLKAGAILEKVLAQQPDHPGVAHYIIHSYDFPPLAQRGLPAARQYAAIAPSAPHALHMPSHIFSMVGLWQELIPADRASLARRKLMRTRTCRVRSPQGCSTRWTSWTMRTCRAPRTSRPRPLSTSGTPSRNSGYVSCRATPHMRLFLCATRSSAAGGRKPPRSSPSNRTSRPPSPSSTSGAPSAPRGAVIS